MPKHAMKGVPDIIVIKSPTGQFVGLEVKTAEGRLRPEQADFGRTAKSVGGAYHVVRSIDDVQRLGL
jgi:hypothetical protein